MVLIRWSNIQKISSHCLIFLKLQKTSVPSLLNRVDGKSRREVTCAVNEEFCKGMFWFTEFGISFIPAVLILR